MELYKELLMHILSKEEVQITFPGLSTDIERVVEMQCYKVLEQIKNVLADDSLDDKSCFMKIEEIVTLFEENGSSGGGRHDFG